MRDDPEAKAGAISRRDAIGAFLLGRRWALAAELLLAPALLALRLAGAIRNPSLLILLIGWLSLWLRRSGWRALGLRRPAHPWRTVLLALGIAVAYDLLDIHALLPVLRGLTGRSIQLESLGAMRGNVGALATWLVVTWTFAAFGEELAYRGYLLDRLADLFGRGRGATVAGAIVASVLFGFAHGAQGMAGVADNVLAGVLFAVLYLATGRNLWLPILVHGFVDTTSFVLLYLGWVPG